MLEQFRALRDASWQVVDAAQSVEVVQQHVRTAADAAVERAAGGAPLRTLWHEAPGGKKALAAEEEGGGGSIPARR